MKNRPTRSSFAQSYIARRLESNLRRSFKSLKKEFSHNSKEYFLLEEIINFLIRAFNNRKRLPSDFSWPLERLNYLLKHEF